MAGSRTLKLSILADIDNLQKNLKTGSQDIESFGDKLNDFGKKAAVAFAAAGAAVGAFALSAVKAAAEDEAAQLKLAETIRSTTAATDAQIAGVEKYITQTSIAAGITDDQLRPAFSRLVRSTNDVEEAQKLLNLALDLAAATGKPLETVTNALGKAYDGNTTALGKLGLGIDATDLKSQSFNTTFQQLTDTFGQFSENEANTTQKQMERVKIALDEAKESIGAALLPVMQELTGWILENFVPALEAFIAGLTGSGGLDEAMTDSQQTALEWGKKVRDFIDVVVELQDEIIVLGAVIAAVFVANKIAAGVTAIIVLINGLIKAYNLLKASSIVAGVAQAFALNPLLGVGAVAVGAAILSGANAIARNNDTEEAKTDLFFPGAGTGNTNEGLNARNTTRSNLTSLRVGGNPVSGRVASSSASPRPTLIEEVTQANFLKNLAPGAFNPGGFRRADEFGNVVINVNAPSIVDEEGFSRAVILALNNSQSRTGSGASQFVDQ